MYLLVPIILTPFLGIFVDLYGQRVTLRTFLVILRPLLIPCIYLPVLLSGSFFLMSMLLLRFARGVPVFVTAYVFYAISQAFTPAPQVEIIRSIIPDAKYFALAFAIKKSVVQVQYFDSPSECLF